MQELGLQKLSHSKRTTRFYLYYSTYPRERAVHTRRCRVRAGSACLNALTKKRTFRFAFLLGLVDKNATLQTEQKDKDCALSNARKR